MVSQFISSHDKRLLGDLKFGFPEETHAIGRLDDQSEGLLLLTTDKRVTRLIFLDKQPHEREYLVMVQNVVHLQTLERLREGIPIKIKNGETYIAVPKAVEVVVDPLAIYPFANDHRQQYPHTWLKIRLTEGKHRQVRKMVMAVRHRCLRLVRLSISGILLGNLAPGEVEELGQKEFYQLLGIQNPD